MELRRRPAWSGGSTRRGGRGGARPGVEAAAAASRRSGKESAGVRVRPVFFCFYFFISKTKKSRSSDRFAPP